MIIIGVIALLIFVAITGQYLEGGSFVGKKKVD